ncbi:MAG TPA: hypothetical protein VIS48_08440 [Candidatus Kryptonia bacterium]
MTSYGSVTAWVIVLAIAVMTLTAGIPLESEAQVKPTLKIKVNVESSVGISKMDAGMKGLLIEESPFLKDLISGEFGERDTVSLSSGYAISAYENISVLVTVTTPGLIRDGNPNSPRITCGYLNDGTTYFRRATITNKSAIDFRLRNNSLLKRSMKTRNPLFVAYVFFLIHQQKEEMGNEYPLPISTVTVEFI